MPVATTRLQVLVDQKDRQVGEDIVQSQYGLSLTQVLRLVVKKIITGEFSIGVNAQQQQVSPEVEKQIIHSLRGGVATSSKGQPLTHQSVDKVMTYLEGKD